MDNPLLLLLGSQAVVFFMILGLYATSVKRVGPNQALIVSGRGNPGDRRPAEDRIFTRAVIGGRTFVWPIIERAEVLSLEAAGTNFKLENVVTAGGGRLTLSGKMQNRIKTHPQAAVKAAMHFLSKTEEERTALVMDVVEDVIRRLADESGREEIEVSPVKFGDKVLEAGRPRLEEMGVEVLSLVIKVEFA